MKREKAIAKQPNKETATATDKRKAARASKGIKIEITAPVAGNFGLSHNIADIVTKDKKQAEELVNAGCAKYV